MKAVASLLWLLLLLLLSVVAQAATLIDDARVVDGDTLAFDGFGVTVRLDGIDAPESRQACESAEGDRYECGMAATRALDEKIAAKPFAARVTNATATSAYLRSVSRRTTWS